LLWCWHVAYIVISLSTCTCQHCKNYFIVAKKSCNYMFNFQFGLYLNTSWKHNCKRGVFLLVTTIMQLYYSCTHDVMLTLLIVIHPLKFNTWHYEDFQTLNFLFFLKYWSLSSIMIVNGSFKIVILGTTKIATLAY
jgi:hypothetical protein